MNVTIVAFQDEKRDRDNDLINAASYRILHPETVDEAAVLYEGLLLEAEETEHEPWEITVLLDGREADTDDPSQDDTVNRIVNSGEAALREAVSRRRAEEKRRAEERAARLRREEEEMKARREEQEKREYIRLKAKFEGEKHAQTGK